MKENLSLLKDLLEPSRTKFINSWLQYQKNTYIDVKLTTHIDFDKKNNKKNPEFKVVDHVRISNYKNIFAKVYVPNWSEEVFVIKKVKNTVPWTYVINDPNGEEIVGTF